VVAFIIKIPINQILLDGINPVRRKRTRSSDLSPLLHNTLVLMIGHLK